MGSHQNRFPQQEQRRKRWVGCLSGLSCFATQKGGKRIVPSRISDAIILTQPNASQLIGTHQTATLSLFAPPSSPVSFTNSAIPSTAQSPNCCLSLSANSPVGPASNIYSTGPYAHETQLVSPPVFSTFTTEPSTAPLTPPPELAFLTTPSSPDVPFARFLSSDHKTTNNNPNYTFSNDDLRAMYSLYSGERGFSPNWDDSNSPQNVKHGGSNRNFQDSNFFCPDTYAQFYLDNPPFPNSGGRISVSRESDVYCSSAQQNWYSKNSKQDMEEMDAYRASFGFSADEIVTTPRHVEILDDSFTMKPFNPAKHGMEEDIVEPRKPNLWGVSPACNGFRDEKSKKQTGDVFWGLSSPDNHSVNGKKVVRANMSWKYKVGLSSSDAEIDYRSGIGNKQVCD